MVIGIRRRTRSWLDLQTLVGIRSRLAEDLKRLLQSQLDQICVAAAKRLGCGGLTWTQLDGLFIPPQLARGLRRRLTQQEYEELERLRRAGDYRGPDDQQRRRLDLRDRESEIRRETVEWEAIRANLGRAVILADPGYGKTTLLSHETGRRILAAISSIEERHSKIDEVELAVFVRTADLASSIAESTASSVAAALVRIVDDRVGVQRRCRQLLEAKLAEGGCLIAVDALDEVSLALRPRIDAALGAYAARNPRARLLVSSRLVGYAGAPFPVSTEEEFEALEFDDTRQERAIRAFFRREESAAEDLLKRIRAEPRIGATVRSPLLLRLTWQLARRASQRGEAAPAPETQTEIYEAFIGDAAERWQERTASASRHQRVELPYFAAEVALRLQLDDSRRTLWDEDDLTRQVNASIDSEIGRLAFPSWRDRCSPLDDLRTVGLFTPVGADSDGTPLMWTHRTFQGYLAARAVAERLRRQPATAESPIWRMLSDKAWDPAWRESFPFLIGRLAQQGMTVHGGRFLGMLAERKADDHLRSRLALAACCLPEISRELRIEYKQTIDLITTRVCSIWWRHYLTLARWRRVQFAIEALSLEPLDVKQLEGCLPSLVLVNGFWAGGSILNVICHRLLSQQTERGALIMLRLLGPAAGTPAILGALERMLADPNGEIRVAALGAVRGLGRAAATPAILVALERLLVDPEWYVRSIAAEAVGSLGATAATTAFLDALDRLLAAPDGGVRWSAVKARATVRGSSAFARSWPAIPVTPKGLSDLEDWLVDPNKSQQGLAAQRAGDLGEAAATPAIVSALERLLAYGSLSRNGRSARQSAVRAMGNMGSAAATPTYLSALERDLNSIFTYRTGGGHLTRRSKIKETLALAGKARAQAFHRWWGWKIVSVAELSGTWTADDL